MGTGTLSNGVATLTTSFSTPGTFTITAVYGGDTNFTGSTSQLFPTKLLAARGSRTNREPEQCFH